MKNLLKFILSKVFVINLVLAIIVFAGVILWVGNYLESYSLHGQTITVPDFTGYKADELDEFIKDKNLRYEIIDSVFNPKKKKGTIVDQNPLADSQVKEGRKIYLTINSRTKQRIFVPDIADASLKQALSILESYGLKVHNKLYIPSELKGNVIRLEKGGKELKPGVSIERGTSVDIVIGQGESDEVISLPDLNGLSYKEVRDYLREKALNVLPINWEGCATESDSSVAKVVKQDPEWIENGMIHLGKTINVWLSCTEETKTE